MKIAWFALVAALLSACGSARVVQRTQYGGIIALEGGRGRARESARAEMAANCGDGNYRVISEGEEVVGTETTHTESTDVDGDGNYTESAETTKYLTEWRLHYECGSGPPGGPVAY